MTAVELLAHLRALDVRLSLEGDRLRCDAPKGAMSAELRAELASRKQELIDFLRTVSAESEELIPQLPANADHLPLSSAQRRFWFLEQLEPGAALYNIPAAVALTGPLDAAALEDSLNEIVRRHAILRSRYRSFDGRPVVEIDPERTMPLPIDDLGSHGTRGAASWRGIAAREAGQGFDIASGPLLRARLIRLAETEHVLLLTLHHLVADGWSLAIMLRELSAIYAARRANVPSPLPRPELQYCDFAAWHNRRIEDGRLDASLAYWRRQLGGELPVLELPTDHPRPPVQTYRGATHRFTLSADLVGGLSETAAAENATLFMTLLAGVQGLLARYTRLEDIIIGAPVAGRQQVQTEDVVGLFVNTLALRTDLAGDPTLRDLLRRVRRTALDAFAHQQAPFERLVEELQRQRERSRSPIFQAMLVLQNAPLPALRMDDIDVSPLPDASEIARFDLTFEFIPNKGGLDGAINYNRDLFEPATIERMEGHLRKLLAAIATEPDRRLEDVELLNAEERRLVLDEFNRTGAEYPCDVCLHELFERQAALTPDAPAVMFEEECLTYAELDARASALALRLRRRGVGPDTLVGVFAERSVELMVGLLGILKAGGAYVPLDPEYPRERIEFMLSDARPGVVLTQTRLRDRLPRGACEILCLDEPENVQPAADSRDVWCRPESENLAYMIYTSGSTGRPKGAMNTHEAIVNRLWWMQDALRLEPGDRVLQKTPLSFDVSVWELFWPLLAGATLVLARPGGHRDPAYLVELIRSRGITTLHFVPSMFQAFLREREVESCRSLRRVVCSGEALGLDACTEFRRRLDAELFNLYGPTEAAVDVTWWPCDRVEGRSTLPIGRPIANTRIYLLDDNLNPVPIGVPGELYIAGANLARGYWDRPDLTAERFVPCPFGGVTGERMYRTGDLARRLPDGDIEFLGRLDHQVKIRGFRIELGEIEACLAGHAGVSQAAVIDHAGANRDRMLAAYYVAAAAPPPEDQLRAYVRERLPDYMVPAVFMRLDALPMLPNGKLDRKRLPAPEIGGSSRAFVPPRTPNEERVAGIWKHVLGIERVGADDHFFELGGHSLLATQVVSRVRDALGAEVPLKTLFDAPVLAEFCATVERERGGHEAIPAPAITSVDRGGDVPLSFAQQRLWFIDRLEPGLTHYNIPLGVRLSGPLCVESLEKALNHVVERHEILRTTFAELEGRGVQRIAPLRWTRLIAEASPDEVCELDDGLETWVRRIAADEAGRPFDLERGPLWRVRLLRMRGDDHVLLITLHHIVADGWSIGVLLRELAAGYEAASAGREPSLAPPVIQYGDFARWQRERLTGDVLDRELEFWRRRLAGELPVLELPTDRRRPAEQTFAGATISRALPGALCAALESLARHEDATLFMTLFAAFNVLLARYTGQDDIIVGTPIAGRQHAETEGLIGLFVNTLAIRTDLSADPSFRALLRDVRRDTLDAYAHQDLPFERLVDEIQPRRDLGRSPIFQVLFILQNMPMPELRLGDLTLAPIEDAGETAKFDLTAVLERGDSGLVVRFNYKTDLFDADTIERMIGHFETLLRGIVEAPDERIARLPLLTEGERREILAEDAASAGAVEDRQPIPEAGLADLFRAQVTRRSDAVALTFDGRSMSYAELDRRSDELVLRLRGLGVSEETPVGIFINRSPDIVVAILAVIKSGGAYLPLDPAYPRERVAFMLDDAGAAVLLTESALMDRVPDGDRAVVCLDRDDGGTANREIELPAIAASGDRAAYIIYTSGSTGRPKGVVVTHDNVVRLFARTREWFEFGERDVWTMFHSHAFDFSVWEIWGALLHGGRLVVVSHEVSRSPDAFWRLLRDERVTVLNQTPSAFRNLLQAEEDEPADGDMPLRLVIFGGEALDLSMLEGWLSRYGEESPRLINMYGITETTVHVTYRPVSLEDARAGRGSLIGGPIPDLRLHVLDQHGALVPIGVPGELYVGGAGLARGYLHRPALTAERFVPDPFGREPGARLYRTGDRVRRLPGGDMEYLGRVDQQVKIRGFRIELGEIESVLTGHPAVRQAAVVVREEPPGVRRLVAYCVAPAGHDIDAGELRSFVAGRLPDYMAPAAIVPLDRLPLTPHGKLDRKALPAPHLDRDECERDCEEPGSPAEQALARAWSEVLGVPRVGRHDNFFELGGDSILSIQMIARAREAGWKITARQVFQQQTVAGLAAVAERIGEPGAGRVSVADSLPLTPIQHWFIEQELSEPNHWNQSVMLKLKKPLDFAALGRALEAVVARHDAWHWRYRRSDGDGRIETVREADIDRSLRLEMHELGSIAEEPRGRRVRRIAEELQRGLNIAAGPLLGAAYLDMDNAEAHRLMIVAHHLAVDGVSWRILLDELLTAYRQATGGRKIDLGARSAEFADWAGRIERFARSEDVAREVEYWTTDGRNDAVAIPLDLPGGENVEESAETVSVSLDREATEALLTHAPQAYRTRPNEILMAALATAVCDWTGGRVLRLAAESHGREELFDDLDVSRTIGWFTSVFPLALELPRSSGPGEILTAIKEQVRAVPHGGIGYGLLRYLGDDPAIRQALEQAGDPEISFNYLGRFDQALAAWAEFAVPEEAPAADRGPGNRRRFVLDVNALVADGRLRVDIVFSRNLHRRTTIERLAGDFERGLRALIAHCEQPDSGGHTPSDFPLAGLDQKSLDRLARTLQKPRKA